MTSLGSRERMEKEISHWLEESKVIYWMLKWSQWPAVHPRVGRDGVKAKISSGFCHKGKKG